MPPIARHLAFAVAAGALTAHLPAQVAWELASAHRTFHASTFDAARGVVLAFGGSFTFGAQNHNTWAWNGSSWRRYPQGLRPSMRQTALAYDAIRQRVVLFGGFLNSGYLDAETWEWDGATWTQRLPVHSPPARAYHALAFDAARGRVVLFGGNVAGIGDADDTWEWDGSDWAQRTPLAAPPPRRGHALAYDPVRARVLLYGGFRSAALADFWEWDGSGWKQITAAPGPGPRSPPSLAWDTGNARLLLHGGAIGAQPNDTWVWNGSSWSVLPVATMAPAAGGCTVAFDAARGRLVQDGGITIGAGVGTWELDGATWTEKAPSGWLGYIGWQDLAYDEARERVVMHTYQGTRGPRTLEWDGERWLEAQFAGAGPGSSDRFKIAYDSRRRRTVLYGGFNYSETWEWDGAAWSQRPTTSGPSPSAGHAMAYDAARGRTAVFVQSTLWEWDGVTWQVRPAAGPPSRTDAVLAFDARRRTLLLYGGRAFVSGARLYDTWEWDGTTWTQRLSAQGPQVGPVGMAYDGARARVVLFGVAGGSNVTWEWDGNAWQQRDTEGVPDPGSGNGLAWDARRRCAILAGGSTLNGNLQQTWSYRPTRAAGFATFGLGCGAVPPTLAAAPDSLPWIGEELAVELGNLSPVRVALAYVGASRGTWGGLPLPLDLGPIGMPGCQMLVSGDLLLPLLATQGRATLRLSLPVDPALAGQSAFVQGLVLDPLANPFGAVMTPGGEAVIGAK